MTTIEGQSAVTDAKRRREQWSTFFGFVAFSIFEIGYLIWQPPTFALLRDWIILGGAIFFPIMAVISYVSLCKSWTPQQEDRATTRTLGFIFLAPVALVGIVLAGFMLFSAFGWFATIPSWAAVIIMLLVLIYLKK
jgi:hypothetical protein